MLEQLAIFPPEIRETKIERSGDLPPDFVIVPHFITESEERELLAAIDREQWNEQLQRRVQQYGYRYDYKARAVGAADRLGDLPEWSSAVATRLVNCEYLSTPPDQVIVNEYLPGQGISSHTDRTTCFGPVVASLSIASDVVMDFSEPSGKSGSVLLPRRSMLVLQGASRLNWRHGIAQRRRDTINATTISRERRVSLTFRTVVLTA